MKNIMCCIKKTVHSEKKVVREFYVLCHVNRVMIADRRCQKIKEDTIETHTHFICYLSHYFMCWLRLYPKSGRWSRAKCYETLDLNLLSCYIGFAS